MLFNSFGFLAFLAAVVLIFYLLPHRFRGALLLLASYIFYASWRPEALLLLVAVTLVAYAGALAMHHWSRWRRPILTAGILIDLGALVVFKYLGFLFDALERALALVPAAGTAALPELRILLPAGLSFYTLSTVSYMIDVYRGTIEPERRLGPFALYVAFFPKIFAGPIERARTFLPQVGRRIPFPADRMAEGLYLFLWGLFKKVVIADRLGVFVDAAYGMPAYTPTVDLVIAVYFYAFQIYCDFSGYTDMARGMARLFGIELMENFRRPYLAKSTGEFWAKRWHLSLTTWFRDYMYIPMGGSRVSRPRRYINLMAVFTVSGLWHGAGWTFLLWGALNGLYGWIEVITAPVWRSVDRRLPAAKDSPLLKVARVVLTFHLITVAWIFFRAPSLDAAWTVLTRIAGSLSMLPRLLQAYRAGPEFILSIVMIGLLLLIELIDERRDLWERLRTKRTAVRWAYAYLLIAGLLVFGKWGLAQFIYMQF